MKILGITRATQKKLVGLLVIYNLCLFYWFYEIVFHGVAEYVRTPKILSLSPVNIVDVRSVYNDTEPPPPNHCVSAKIRTLVFPVCTYGRSDIHISAGFLNGQYWDERYVTYVMNLMNADPRLVFIDIGANIGAYTLAVAHMGRKVVAVEPNTASVRLLSESIVRGNVSNFVTLLKNAVSDERVTVGISEELENRGGTRILNSSNCSVVNGRACDPNVVQTITLDDHLLPLMMSNRAIMKIDIEGYELRALSFKGSRKFFTLMKIPVILMEFRYYLLQRGDIVVRKAVDRWLTFLYSVGYTFHHYDTFEKLGADWLLWPVDVILTRDYDLPLTSSKRVSP